MMQNFVLSGKSCNTIQLALLCKEVLKKIQKFYLYIFLLGQLEDSLLLLSLLLLLLSRKTIPYDRFLPLSLTLNIGNHAEFELYFNIKQFFFFGLSMKVIPLI